MEITTLVHELGWHALKLGIPEKYAKRFAYLAHDALTEYARTGLESSKIPVPNNVPPFETLFDSDMVRVDRVFAVLELWPFLPDPDARPDR